MSHSERCLSANRFGDGFDCICEPSPQLCPGCGGLSVDGGLCSDCRRASDETASYRAGYEAGLRRAQELAKELSFEAWGEELHILAPELYEAVDAEAAKVST